MPLLKNGRRESSSARFPVAGFGINDAVGRVRDEYVSGLATREAPAAMHLAGLDRQVCANVECSGGWTMPWKNRRRPIFEGGWGCSTRCLESIIHRALRRERGDVRAARSEGPLHQHRIPLGLVMLSQGWINQAQLRKALNAQRIAGAGRIGEWLVYECGVPQAQITRGLAVQWSCPVLPLDGFVPLAMALTVPRILVEELGLLPLRVAGSRILYVAFRDRLDASGAFAVEQMSRLRVESGLLDDSHFQAAQSRLLASSFVTSKQQFFHDADTLAGKITTILQQAQPVQARLVRVHQHYWLRCWLEQGAYSGVGTLPGSVEDVTDTIFTPSATS